jgi:hypothetical protein
MLDRLNRPLAAIAAVAALGLAGALPGVALARHGADDPPGHEAAHHHRGHHGRHHAGARIARHGHDDPPGDDNGGKGHGADDGPNHR